MPNILCLFDGELYIRHEHLYEKLRQNVIESSELSKSIVMTQRRFLDARVILCTLSMLSNVRLAKAGLFRLFPLRTLIVDEASQIELGGYLPVFHNFEKTLRRVCFVGDDKQRRSRSIAIRFILLALFSVPPYGQEDIPELQSIFEIQYHRRHAIFLDTQCESRIAVYMHIFYAEPIRCLLKIACQGQLGSLYRRWHMMVD